MPVFDGIRVSCFGSALALDLATMVLSDNGAEVVRVEPPGGDPRREQAAWRMWNRGARSIVLDPSAVADRGTAAALVARADVLLEAWRPGEAAAWGEQMTTRNIDRRSALLSESCACRSA